MLIEVVFSSFFALVLTPISIKMARKMHLVDKPGDCELKIHRRAVPNIGGLPLLFSIVAVFMIDSNLRDALHQKWPLLLILFAVLVALGFIDDRKTLSVRLRLPVHFLVAGIVTRMGYELKVFEWPMFNFLLTVFLLVGVINAMNLLDGMDGLATGISAICSIGLIMVGTIQGNFLVVGLGSVLTGALLGFLPFNFHPARIFLGDSGSTLIGFILGILIVSTSDASSPIYLVAAVLIVGVPFADTFFAVLRRAARGENIFAGDRGHFYDRLLAKGYSQEKVALIGYGFSVALSGLSLMLIGLWG
jgi:UDP-GlcNAc:undecaprenyl-phosphate/decaprenyl-phosphate GlcNAc-1-phosphate transferase